MLTSRTLRPAPDELRFSVVLILGNQYITSCFKAFAYQSWAPDQFELICLAPETRQTDVEAQHPELEKLHIRWLTWTPPAPIPWQEVMALKPYEYILLWHPDFLPQADLLRNLAKTLASPLRPDILVGANSYAADLAPRWLHQALLTLGLPFSPPEGRNHRIWSYQACPPSNLVLRRQCFENTLTQLQAGFTTPYFQGLAWGLALVKTGYRMVFEAESRAVYQGQWSISRLQAQLSNWARDIIHWFALNNPPLVHWELGHINHPRVRQGLEHQSRTVQPLTDFEKLTEQNIYQLAEMTSPDELSASFAYFQGVFLSHLYKTLLAYLPSSAHFSYPPLIYPGYRDVISQSANPSSPEIQALDALTPTPETTALKWLCHTLAHFKPNPMMVAAAPQTLMGYYLLQLLQQHRGHLQLWDLLPQASPHPEANPEHNAIQAASNLCPALPAVQAAEVLLQTMHQIDILLLPPGSFASKWQVFLAAQTHMQPGSLLVFYAAHPSAMQAFHHQLLAQFPFALLAQSGPIAIYDKFTVALPNTAPISDPLLCHQDDGELYASP